MAQNTFRGTAANSIENAMAAGCRHGDQVGAKVGRGLQNALDDVSAFDLSGDERARRGNCPLTNDRYADPET
jgi:hypothetical protein